MSEFQTPRSLPADGKGYRKRMLMHLNFGSAGGSAVYAVVAPSGKETAIRYQYDTRKEGGGNGFFVHGVTDAEGNDRLFKWSELVAFWPQYLKTHRRSGAAAAPSMQEVANERRERRSK